MKCKKVYEARNKHTCGEVLDDEGTCKRACRAIKGDDAKCLKRCKKMVSWDIESDTVSQANHVPNVVCWQFSDFDGELEDDTGRVVLGENGCTDVIQTFMDMLTTDPRFLDATIFAHNGGGYDTRFAKKYLN